jgi:DNA-binding transcriptional LysR family regulator
MCNGVVDRLEAMAAFVAVAELRGFAPAARRLQRSPSAVTRLVAALEDRLSVRLLQRTTRSVALTGAGARYLDHARRILAAVDEAEGNARAERTEPAGRFVVAAPQVFGRREVAPLMFDFLARHAKVSGEITLADRVVHLVEEGVDLAVRIGVLEDSSLVARKVGETRRVVVGSPGYLAGRNRPRSPADLASHAIVHFSGLSPSPEWRFSRGGREERASVAPRFATNSAEAAIGHAERGGGLTMVLGYQVMDAVKQGKLEVVLPGYEPPPLPIHLVHPGSRLPSANVRAFVDLTLSTRDWRFVDF